MIDYVQVALDGHMAKEKAKAERMERERAAKEAILENHLKQKGQKISAALAATFSASPTDEEFANLTWQYVPPYPDVEIRDGRMCVVPGEREREVRYQIDFQGVIIEALELPDRFLFTAVNKNRSALSGFDDLESFGSAVAHVGRRR